MEEKERKLDKDDETEERMKREAFNQCAMPRHTITTTTNNMRIRPISLLFFHSVRVIWCNVQIGRKIPTRFEK